METTFGELAVGDWFTPVNYFDPSIKVSPFRRGSGTFSAVSLCSGEPRVLARTSSTDKHDPNSIRVARLDKPDFGRSGDAAGSDDAEEHF